ncbi:neocarzinostatin apoprotein domain-containing protein [Streptomyces sp. G-G2]|uniref:neocarzinostatin apoprotein domain-containing protein n=1 Tax=Streptomyces sp. G-G2 TaxID=3046201 RepID=UPI0024B9039C|nr:neocarzinostatin apoprotein domain-containing protein [Streptomyces sp. G-G2]MDJ0385176.1 neocarzinostatin apoprotein domain-containing protein [Streptomyces sp. G-G2]
MELRRNRSRDKRAGAVLRGAVALALTCAGIAALPAAAQAASTGSGASACRAAADGAGGSPVGPPVPDSRVAVDRTDGRTAQFQLFRDTAAPGSPAAVWHREQSAPDSVYAGWHRIGATGPSPDGTRVSAIENAGGRLELLFPASGSLCHTVQDGSPAGWSVPDRFGPAPSPDRLGARTPSPRRGGSADGFAAGTTPEGPRRSADTPGAAAAPLLKVHDTTGLLDGDIVTFGITGGPPKAYVWVKQCGPSASATTCDDDTGRQFRVYPDGTYQLSPKKLYARLATAAGTVDCRTTPADDPCTLALTDNDGALLTTVPLRFRPKGPLEAPPTLHVDPDKGLVDGQSVRATGKGYEPRCHVLVMECATGSADTLGCRPRSRPPATSDTGRIDETVTLSATFTAIDGRGVDCRTGGACELVVFGSRVRGPDSVHHPLTFTPPPPGPRPEGNVAANENQVASFRPHPFHPRAR